MLIQCIEIYHRISSNRAMEMKTIMVELKQTGVYTTVQQAKAKLVFSQLAVKRYSYSLYSSGDSEPPQQPI